MISNNQLTDIAFEVYAEDPTYYLEHDLTPENIIDIVGDFIRIANRNINFESISRDIKS